ncbi:MAG: TetR/AcrR family transcriptional regulator [Chloroflexi bacterium]|nr:TetR/AcrR family transcriptional regulator [Chloroflexota bacterium]
MSRQEERKEATRQRILAAAIEVFADKGYHAAGVQDIVRASDTSKGAFYFHFPGKQEIFLALVDELAALLLDRTEAAIGQERGALAKVDAALRTVLAAFSDHRRLAKILLVDVGGVGPALDEKLLALHARFAATIRRHLDEALAEGSIPPLDTEVAAYAWVGAINEIVLRWLYTRQPDPLLAALPALREVLLRGIGAPSPRAP